MTTLKYPDDTIDYKKLEHTFLPPLYHVMCRENGFNNPRQIERDCNALARTLLLHVRGDIEGMGKDVRHHSYRISMITGYSLKKVTKDLHQMNYILFDQ